MPRPQRRRFRRLRPEGAASALRSARALDEAETALTSRICPTVLQSASSRRGAQTSTTRHCARDVATLNRWRLKAKPIPRGASSGGRARHRDEHDRRLLPLELVDGADANASGHARAQRPHLRVVRRDDEDVAQGSAAARAVVVRERRPERARGRPPRPRPPPRPTTGCVPRAGPGARPARSPLRATAARPRPRSRGGPRSTRPT